MKKQFIFLFTTLFLCKTLSAQGVEFTVNLSNDTVLLGNYIEVEYTISNGDGKFIPPLFAGLQLIAGPNKSSSYSVINGVVSQSAIIFLQTRLEIISFHLLSWRLAVK